MTHKRTGRGVGLAALSGALLATALLAPARADTPRRAKAGDRPVVAVLPFTSPTRYNEMGRNAQEAFVTTLVKTRRVRVIQATIGG